MDVRLPGIDGVSTVKKIHQSAPNVQIVMFSAYGDKRLLSDAIQAGAKGYVMKGSPPEDLMRAIRTVAEGRPFVDPSLSPTLLMTDTDPGDNGRCPSASARSCSYSPRATTPRRSRGRIGLSAETVKADTKRVIGRFQADSRTHAVAIALRQALIE